MSTDYHPAKFVDELEPNKHTVMLYDNEKYADLIIARYFLNGLKNGESCIFFTSNDHDTIEERLAEEGIDVQAYEKAGLLRIYHMKPPPPEAGNMDPLTVLKAIRSDAVKGMKPPYRFAGRTIPDIESKEGMLSGLAVERTGQEHFAEFDNAQMCFYDISKLEKTMRDEWVTELIKNHHNVIYASAPDKAVAFDSALLVESEE